MAPFPGRGLVDEFMNDLHDGILEPLRNRVRQDTTLCLEIRENYFNIYYRGGSLMKVMRVGAGYAATFDPKYLAGVEQPPPLPMSRIEKAADVSNWMAALPWLKQAMDLSLGRHPKEEREVQQRILRENNLAGCARATDYYVCDIEYASPVGRFDAVAVRWPSSPEKRKEQTGHRLAIAEVKYGDGALSGDSGLLAHVSDIEEHLAKASTVASLKAEMVQVFNQKRKLGLIDCDKDLVSFSDEPPLLILVLANHDPEATKMRELLRMLPQSPGTGVHEHRRIATSCLVGYGLYEPGILTIEEAFERFGTHI